MPHLSMPHLLLCQVFFVVTLAYVFDEAKDLYLLSLSSKAQPSPERLWREATTYANTQVGKFQVLVQPM